MKKAFTLIELLIVVAIIAILAAIAVPNFLEAQVRAKVSRAKTDMRTIATGMESYHVDSNKYPFGSNSTSAQWGLVSLSTPIAYITNGLLPDPFVPQGTLKHSSENGTIFDATVWNRAIKYSLRGVNTAGATDVGISGLPPQEGRWWLVHTYGPDGKAATFTANLAANTDAAVAATSNILYDATNGTISRGDIFRANGAPEFRPGQLMLQYSGK